MISAWNFKKIKWILIRLKVSCWCLAHQALISLGSKFVFSYVQARAGWKLQDFLQNCFIPLSVNSFGSPVYPETWKWYCTSQHLSHFPFVTTHFKCVVMQSHCPHCNCNDFTKCSWYWKPGANQNFPSQSLGRQSHSSALTSFLFSHFLSSSVAGSLCF